MMKTYLPEENEIESLRKYQGDLGILSPVDQYVFLLSKLPFYKLLIDIGIAKTTFNEKIDEFIPALKGYKQACKGK